jgi:hypothetical protein
MKQHPLARGRTPATARATLILVEGGDAKLLEIAALARSDLS